MIRMKFTNKTYIKIIVAIFLTMKGKILDTQTSSEREREHGGKVTPHDIFQK